LELPSTTNGTIFFHYPAVRFSTIAFKSYSDMIITMAEKEYKEKVKIDDDEAKIERESKDSFGNKVKEKHEIKSD
jgi:hypothetical protein